MSLSMYGRFCGAVMASCALLGCDSTTDHSSAEPRSNNEAAADPPNEGVILFEELVHVVERSGLYSIPNDPALAAEAIAGLPQQIGNAIGMHLGRLHPTPHEFTPAVAPLGELLQARIDLLLNGQPMRIIENTQDGEVAILLLPLDATTVIVILPTQVVESDPNAPPLPESRVDLSQVSYEINGRTRTIGDFMQGGNTNAIGFLHQGQFIYDDYENGYTADTRAHMWSVTKSVTTALVGIAVSEGLIDSIFDPVKKYIPEATDTVWEGTSVEDLLHMESGTYWVDVPIHQPEQLVLMGADYHSNGLYGMTRDDYLLRLTRTSEPGEFHRYNSGDTQMLAWILENVYQRPYAEILSEKIWRPAGMQDDALVMIDRLGNTFASMGLMATTRDMLRFGELFRRNGVSLDGKQIVPRAWVEASHNYDKDNGGGPRGYQWPHWGGVESGNFAAVGYGHQNVSVAPSLKMVGARFGNDPVDSIAPKEWEAALTAVGNYMEFGQSQR